MRKYFSLALALAALAVLAAQPAFAVCGAGSGPLQSASPSGTSWIYSNPNWCGPTATFCSGTGPALTQTTRSLFWSRGTGNPTVGAGDDNGSFGGGYCDQGTAGCSGSGEWLVSLFTDGFGFYGPALTQGGWGSSAAVDGCILNNNPGGCTCVLITDEWNGVGYFLMAANTPQSTGEFRLNQPGNAPLRLEPIPKPGITGTARIQPSLDLDATVKLDAPAAGLYQLNGCDCSPIGFKVLQQVLPDASPAPVSRDAAQWSEPTRSDGSPQPATGTPFGTAVMDGVTVRSACGMTDTDVYLATQLVFPDGFVSPTLSENSTQIECGPNLANPEPRPDRPGRRPDTPGNSGKGRVPVGPAGGR